MEFESFEVISFSPTYIHEFQEHGSEVCTDSSVSSWVVDYEQKYGLLEACMGSSGFWVADCGQEYGLKVHTGSSVGSPVTECGQEYELEVCADNSVGYWATDRWKDQSHDYSNDVDIQECLQLETDIMDLDFIDEDAVFSQNSREQETAVTPTGEAGACGFLTPENCSSHLRTIQEEGLMEETKTSLIDLLLMGAQAVQAGNRDLASIIVLKLNNLHLSGEEEESGHLERLSLYFTQGLVFKTMNYGEQKWQEGSMSAFQMLQEISPYIKFAHFTANQAILEATQNQKEVHIIDFDIMEGIQWPPLMAELADRENASLRITAMVAETQSWAHTQQTGKRLHEFANSINLSFAFDQILLTKEQDLEQIQSLGNHPIANLMIHQLHMPHRENPLIKIFLNGLRNPQMIIMVEEELFKISRTPSMSFVEFFREAIHHYTSLSDSLQGGFCGGYKLAQRVIEKEFLGPRIMDSVSKFPSGKRERQTWSQGVYSLKGFKPVPMSSCNVSQAKYLVSLFNGGFWVQHEHCRLALCWKSRPLITASIWVPTTSSISHSSLSRSTSFD
ncbi:PREDICTED: nodulation-signaling pathway 2 protein-like [Ipomoea nil]|uniref:nodulation-signaling pathway 2 protein-like n=1 Tax=Ipomoea nil TaxID=35883 RepID=UPI000901B06D|nr:PREDICTED: nodulation-signaling pathway 2 protein-like [Ipomoea nil]